MHRAQDAAILGLLLESARRALVGDQAHTQRYLGYVITSLRRATAPQDDALTKVWCRTPELVSTPSVAL
jgi:hypothetical protein